MIGQRIRPDENGIYPYDEASKPGVFFQWEGEWYGTTPNGHMAALRKHTVTEHEDGTITVSPSILVTGGQGESWHGFLERGVWRQC